MDIQTAEGGPTGPVIGVYVKRAGLKMLVS
jgi:hypothetical protein